MSLLCAVKTSRHVKVTHLNEKEAMYERPRVNVKVEGGSTFTYTRDVRDYRETNDKRNN